MGGGNVDIAVRAMIFPIKLIFAIIGAFMKEIIEFIVMATLKLIFGLFKHLFMSCIKLAIKGNTIERIIFLGLLALEFILLANGYWNVQFIPIFGIMIMGGLKK